jgi:hypothetical protein
MLLTIYETGGENRSKIAVSAASLGRRLIDCTMGLSVALVNTVRTAHGDRTTMFRDKFGNKVDDWVIWSAMNMDYNRRHEPETKTTQF